MPSLGALAKDGRIQAGGLYVGARSGVSIVATGSHDEVTDLVHALPAWGVWNRKVMPLGLFRGWRMLSPSTSPGEWHPSPFNTGPMT